MSKIILNECYGGYSWNMAGVYAVVQKKSGVKKFLADVYPKAGEPVIIQVGKEEFFRMNEQLSKLQNYCGPNGIYVGDLMIEDNNGKTWEWNSVDRRDPDAIATLEEYGSEFCSGRNAELRIDVYDEDLFTAYVDEYDGWESLELKPNLSEERIRACKDIDEVVELLKQTGAITEHLTEEESKLLWDEPFEQE